MPERHALHDAEGRTVGYYTLDGRLMVVENLVGRSRTVQVSSLGSCEGLALIALFEMGKT